MGASLWRISAGPRKVLARTCLSCGSFQQAAAFNRNSRGYTDTDCSACRARAARGRASYRARANAAALTRHAGAQNRTTLAFRRGQVWTMPELEVLEREDLSDEQRASLLGRTYYAVTTARHALHADPERLRILGATASTTNRRSAP